MNNQEDIPHQNIQLGLPKKVESICPECKKLIPADIVEENGQVIMKKKCSEHGEFMDILSRNVDFYLKAEKWSFSDADPTPKPITKSQKGCPYDCGLCTQHLGNACLTNIDLTNRCNQRCPICFANAAVTGYVYELTLDQVKDILKNIKERNPQDRPAVQFSGGEPTIHPQFLECIKAAKEIGIGHIQIATNGVELAKSLDFAKKAKEAGLDTAYLQFDGVGDEHYIKTRGIKNLFTKIKLKAIENCRKAGIAVCLVPTIVKTINDSQVGEIVKFAINNADVVTGISFQPVAFTGRISKEQRLKERYTLSDLAFDIEKQTGYLKALEDWYPLSVTMPLSRLYSRLYNQRVIEISNHAHCGMGTYLVVHRYNHNIKPVPITKLLDIENMMLELDKLAGNISLFKTIDIVKALNIIRKHFKKENAPEGMSIIDFMKMIKSYGKPSDSKWRMLIVAGMHFQDAYNFQTDRVRRCVIHYGAPDNRLYPFCTYNSGLVYREEIEKKYSIPVDEWIKKHGDLYIKTGIYRGEWKNSTLRKNIKN